MKSAVVFSELFLFAATELKGTHGRIMTVDSLLRTLVVLAAVLIFCAFVQTVIVAVNCFLLCRNHQVSVVNASQKHSSGCRTALEGGYLLPMADVAAGIVIITTGATITLDWLSHLVVCIPMTIGGKNLRMPHNLHPSLLQTLVST